MMDNTEAFNQEMSFAFKEIQGSTAWSMDRNRPYDGQPQTDTGVRGKTLVEGLTMRDIADCMIMGFIHACSSQKNILNKNLVWDDVYKLNLGDMDAIAMVQCTMCEIEKMMGIYPNVPKLYNTNGEELK